MPPWPLLEEAPTAEPQHRPDGHDHNEVSEPEHDFALELCHAAEVRLHVDQNVRVRRRVARPIVALAIATLTLVAADRLIGWVRGPVIKPVNAMGLTSSVNEVGTHLRPGFDGTYTNGEFSIHIHVNSLGMRGPEISGAKPGGEYRIVALGDSFTFGQGVEYDQAWPELVERGLGPPVKVVNAGWSAGSPVGYERYLLSHGMALHPDLVLMAVFVGNDVVDDMAERHAGASGIDQLEYESRYLNNLQVRFGPVGTVRELLDDALPNIYELATLAIVKTQYLIGSHRSHFDYILSNQTDPDLEAGWADTLATIGRIDAMVRGAGARLGVIVIPFYDQVAPTSYGPEFTKELPQRRIMTFCALQGISCLDLLPALRSEGRPDNFYYLKDGHWTPRGQVAAAAEIASWVRALKLLP